MYWYSVFPLLSIFLCTLLIIRSSSFLKTRSRQFFLLTIICLWFWTFDELVYPGVPDARTAEYIKSVGVTFLSLTPFFYALSMIYLERKPRWWEYLLLILPIFILPRIWLEPYPAFDTGMGWKINFYDNFYTLWHMVLGLCMVYGIARTFIVASKIDSPEAKRKVNLLIVGAVSCVVLAQVLTLIGKMNLYFPYIGSIGAGLFCILMFAALFK